MDINTFWNIIEETKTEAKQIENFESVLSEKLKALSDEDLLDFQVIYEMYEMRIISLPWHFMWSALIFVNGGYCTDTYGFAGWLIISGKQIYTEVLANADNLVATNPKKDKCNYKSVRRLGQNLFMERTKTKIRAYKSLTSEIWNSPKGKSFQQEIDNSLIINEEKRDRNWTTSDLAKIFPKLDAFLKS